MILSNRSIHAALDDGRLILTPEPAPRQPGPDVECPYQTSAVDLRLGNEISWLKKGMPLTIDLRGGNFAALAGPNSETRKLENDQPFLLEPNQFVLAKTLERVELPIRDGLPSLAARIEGRSSYARCGLLIHFTAPTIHAGFAGTITMEMINLGPYSISLFAGVPICQLILETVDGIPFRRDSQFQQQDRPGGVF